MHSPHFPSLCFVLVAVVAALVFLTSTPTANTIYSSPIATFAQARKKKNRKRDSSSSDDTDKTTATTTSPLQNKTFNKIIAIGDLHGDLSQTLTIFQNLGIISLQPYFYKEHVIPRQQMASRRSQQKVLHSYEVEAFTQEDISKKMIYDRRGGLMAGTTADQFHWAANDTMVVLLGDIFDVGPDDIGVASLVHRLAKECHLFGGRLVFTLGNHEVMNLQGNYGAVHPWSFENSGGSYGRLHQLSTANTLGRYLRGRGVMFYYDGLLFLHGGVYPSAIGVVEAVTQNYNLTAREMVNIINAHTYDTLVKHENDTDLEAQLDSDDIAALGLKVDYNANGRVGVLLVHPLRECDKIVRANTQLHIQAQIVGHTPHSVDNYRLCNGSLYGVDFGMSKWKGGANAPAAGLVIERVPVSATAASTTTNSTADSDATSPTTPNAAAVSPFTGGLPYEWKMTLQRVGGDQGGAAAVTSTSNSATEASTTSQRQGQPASPLSASASPSHPPPPFWAWGPLVSFNGFVYVAIVTAIVIFVEAIKSLLCSSGEKH